MSRCRFREVAGRFGHIDGTFVAASLGWPEENAFLAIRYYPWWEHPLYRNAVASGKPWGFDLPDEASQVVRIIPINLLEFRMSAKAEYTDAGFAESHPHLWSYEEEGQVFCNEPVDLTVIGREVAMQLGSKWRAASGARLAPFFFSERARDLGRQAPFSLRLPLTLHRLLRSTLESLGKEHFVAYEPREESVPAMFYVDDTNYIIARDFEVEMPDFEFREEWFKAERYQTPT